MSTSYSVNAVKIKKPTKRQLANIFRSLATAARTNRIRRNNGLLANENVVQSLVRHHFVGKLLPKGHAMQEDALIAVEDYLWETVNSHGLDRQGYGMLLNSSMLMGDVELEKLCRRIANSLDHGKSVSLLESCLRAQNFTW